MDGAALQLKFNGLRRFTCRRVRNDRHRDEGRTKGLARVSGQPPPLVYEVAEIPPLGILGRGHRRLVPHIYTEEELTQLLQATNRLTPRGGLRPLTYRTLFGLIVAAGLRLSEALNLTVGDVNLAAGAVTIRQSSSASRDACPCTAA